MRALSKSLALFLLLACLNDVFEYVSSSEPRAPVAPDIFLLGAGKCGSTSLHDLIVKHAEICPSKVKEFHFFSESDFSTKRVNWYEEQFLNRTNCAVGARSIDGTPRYIRSEQAPKRMKEFYGTELAKKKFVVVLREPVSREFSWYRHNLRSCLPSIRQAVNKQKAHNKDNSTAFVHKHGHICKSSTCQVLGCREVVWGAKQVQHPERYLYNFEQYMHHTKAVFADSAYVLQIRNWLQYISREQLFIISIQTLLQNTPDAMHRLSVFLNFNSGWGKNATLPHRNENKIDANITCRSYDTLYKHYEPLNRQLYKLVNARQGKPASEPHFPNFDNTRNICV